MSNKPESAVTLPPLPELDALTERLREMSKRGHWPLLGYEAADEIDDLRAQVAAVTAERDALRADAERYRWLRAKPTQCKRSPP